MMQIVDHTPPQLRIQLFGSPQIIHNGTHINELGNKAQALLIYLAVTERVHSRDALSELLWADNPTTKRGNLRKALQNLRKLDGVKLLEEGRHQVQLEPGTFTCDVLAFTQLISNDLSDHTDWEQAVELYEDDFLKGYNVSLSLEFETWALGEQARLKEQMIGVLVSLSGIYEKENELSNAVASVRRLLQLEPWREEAHRQLMLLLLKNGDRRGAIAQFEECKRNLAEELAVEPEQATLDLIAQIRKGTYAPPANEVPRNRKRSVNPNWQKQAKTVVDYPLVGREAEWQTLKTAWRQLKGSYLVTINGEAGIGKTRLAEELLLLAESEDAHVARTRSHELQGQLAYGPITDWLRSPPLRVTIAQLETVWRREISRLLPELMTDGAEPPEPLRESWQRKRLFDAMLCTFDAVAHPLLLVIDDLQWSDSDTLELIQYLVESLESSILVVATVRIEELHANHPYHRVRQQLQRQDKITEIQLAALTEASATQLAATVDEGWATTVSSEQLLRDTAGNPLFVIESTRVGFSQTSQAESVLLPNQILEQQSNHSLRIPAKIYAVIQSNLAQLSPDAQQLSQLCATIGRAFDMTLLTKAADRDENEVLTLLDELWQRRIIQEVDGLHFDFRHDRIRDVAYAEISPIRRRLLHRDVATALEAIYKPDLASAAGQLAIHSELAGLLDQAVAFYQLAANRAREIFAHREAIGYRQNAIDALHKLPRHLDNQRAEVDLLLELHRDQNNAKGLADPSTAQSITAAYELAVQIGTPLQQINILTSMNGYERVCGNWIRAHELAIKAYQLAEEYGDQDLFSNTRASLIPTLVRRGNLSEAHIHLETMQRDARPIRAGSMTRLGYAYWLSGYPIQAQKLASESLRIRREDEQLHLTIPLHHYSSILMFCGDISQVDTLSSELVNLATERKDDFSLRWGLIYRGWLLVQQGNLKDGIALMRDNADEHRKRNNFFYECIWRSMLAEAYLQDSDLDNAFQEINSTLAFADKSGDVHWNAQLIKQRGDYLLASGAAGEVVEEAYQQAIDISRKQTARSLELRATTSLCRLWQRQGKAKEAHQVLSQIYDWFTEGFDTRDLVEARTLLDTLALSFATNDKRVREVVKR